MRTRAALLSLGVLTGCRGAIIDAGTNVPPEAGASTPVPSADDTLNTNDTCSIIEAKSLDIRTHSCAMCHGPPPAPAPQYNWILDDHKLVAQNGPIVNNPLVLIGDPQDSPIMVRITDGFDRNALGMPPQQGVAGQFLVDPTVIVYPSQDAYWTLYAWIQNCVQEADGGTNPRFDLGAQYTLQETGPDGGLIPIVDAGASE